MGCDQRSLALEFCYASGFGADGGRATARVVELVPSGMTMTMTMLMMLRLAALADSH